MFHFMGRGSNRLLRTGFTTGACATAAAAAACQALMTGKWPNPVSIRLPNGKSPSFSLQHTDSGEGWARSAVRKDAGDDPDVTHGALIEVEVRLGKSGSGVTFIAGRGVGIVTKPGLPITVGEPAINPVPRRMMCEALSEIAAKAGRPCDFTVEISIPGGEELALKTWNPRLGIAGGLSILGTTGIVKPYSCSAWIASIHRGVDVARANGVRHVVGSTGSTSEASAQRLYGYPDMAMLDMGDFVGGMLKYIRRHPVPMVTVAGGFGKLTKLAQGAIDLHSSRSQVDFGALALLAKRSCKSMRTKEFESIVEANTAQQALTIAGAELASAVAEHAASVAEGVLRDAPTEVEIMVFSRDGRLVARHSRTQFPVLLGAS